MMKPVSNPNRPSIQRPNRVDALLRLTRIDRPVGIWLLLWPCWWSVSLSHEGPLLDYVLLLIWFGLGAIIMRSAGCVLNDMADRKFDPYVERTRLRPLASGELTLADAIGLLAFLLSLALLIVLQLHPYVLLWAVGALGLVVAYPFMKRITYWPQAFLGLTFNSGAILGWVATKGSPAPEAWWLYAAGIAWTIGYDTLYAHQDIEDDLRIGVKSTAIRFGRHSKAIIFLFYIASAVCMGMSLQGFVPFWANLAAPALMALFGAYFYLRTNLSSPPSCLRAFKANVLLGGLLWLCFLAGH